MVDAYDLRDSENYAGVGPLLIGGATATSAPTPPTTPGVVRPSANPYRIGDRDELLLAVRDGFLYARRPTEANWEIYVTDIRQPYRTVDVIQISGRASTRSGVNPYNLSLSDLRGVVVSDGYMYVLYADVMFQASLASHDVRQVSGVSVGDGSFLVYDVDADRVYVGVGANVENRILGYTQVTSSTLFSVDHATARASRLATTGGAEVRLVVTAAQTSGVTFAFAAATLGCFYAYEGRAWSTANIFNARNDSFTWTGLAAWNWGALPNLLANGRAQNQYIDWVTRLGSGQFPEYNMTADLGLVANNDPRPDVNLCVDETMTGYASYTADNQGNITMLGRNPSASQYLHILRYDMSDTDDITLIT